MSTKPDENIVFYQRENPLESYLYSGSLHGLFQQDKGAYGLRISLELLCSREIDTPIRREE